MGEKSTECGKVAGSGGILYQGMAIGVFEYAADGIFKIISAYQIKQTRLISTWIKLNEVFGRQMSMTV